MRFNTVLALSWFWGAIVAQDGYSPRTIYVRQGQSIQAAIDGASAGDIIVVAAGTYTEQVTIKLDGIQLIGKGAKLTAPTSFTKNVCTNETGPGSQAGICVQGSGIKRDTYYTEHRKVLAVKRAVKGVSIKGFEVSGFSGANIMVIGGQDTAVTNNTLVDGPTYGFLTVGSVDTRMERNIITSSTPEGSGFIAMCMDNFEGAFAFGNTITNYVIGLCVQTKGAMLQQNIVSSTCKGVFLDPFVQQPKILNNHIGSSFPCGDFGSNGIVLDGSNGAIVQHNLIESQTSNNGPAAGLVVVDDPCGSLSPSCPVVNKTAVATSNIVTYNTFLDNDFDIYVDMAGKYNRLKPNKCSTSSPTRLCKST